jgi:hypothetical protein
MTARFLSLTIALMAVVACRDITRSIEPTTEVTEDTVTVFALSGSPLSAPTAVDLFLLRTLRVGENAVYDIAIDTAGGSVRLYPAQLLDAESARVAFLEVTAPFDSILEAPTAGYVDTAAVTIDVGETVIVRARNVCAGSFTGRDIFYAKVQLLAVGTVSGFRTAYLRVRTNPNCGFRSFADGLPEF